MACNQRERSTNYNEIEKNFLLEIIREHPIIFTKQRDKKTLNASHLAWKAITDTFNQNPDITKRSTDSLRSCVMNMTGKAKKEDSSRKRSLYETGGGPSSAPVTETTSSIIQMMPQVFSSHNVDDDDFINDDIGESFLILNQEWVLINNENYCFVYWYILEPNPKKSLLVEQGEKKNQADGTKIVGKKLMELNDYRRQMLKENHEKSLVLMQEKHQWDREKHLLEMEVLQLQKVLLTAQLAGYRNVTSSICTSENAYPPFVTHAPTTHSAHASTSMIDLLYNQFPN